MTADLVATWGCRDGDFERQARPLLQPLYRRAMRMTGNHADAEDLLQEAMLKAYAGRHTFREGSNFAAWMYRILTNSYITGYRRRQRQPAHMPLEEVTDQRLAASSQHSSTGWLTAEDEALNALPDKQIAAALSALPEQYRTAIYYADIEGFRCKEVAAIMNTPVGTVISRLHRGRRLLRKLLADVAKQRGYELAEPAAA